MFSPEFQTVYNEAFLSGTGTANGDPTKKDERDAYIAETETALLSHWTDPTYDSHNPLNDEVRERGAFYISIKHPSTSEFDKDDARDIAQIRYLGHAIVAIAAMNAPVPDIDDSTRGMSFSRWYNAHNENFPEDRAHDPDCASPVRLTDWPNGEYVNCLGTAIAAAGQEKREDIPAYFGTRIRSSWQELGTRTGVLLEKLQKKNPKTMRLLKQMMFVRGIITEKSQKRYLDIYKEFLDYDTKLIDDSFHHFIATTDSDILGHIYQVDPSAFVNAALVPYPLTKSLKTLIETQDAGHCNEVIHFKSDLADFVFDELFITVDNSHKIAAEYADAIDQPMNSEQYMANAHAAFYDLYSYIGAAHHLRGEHNFSLDMDKIKKAAPHFRFMERDCDMLWLYRLLVARMDIVHSTKDPLMEQGLELFVKSFREISHQERERQIAELIPQLEAFFAPLLKHDGQAQRALHDTLEDGVVFLLIDHLHGVMRMGDYQAADQAMELGDTDFMVGTMYLNHYARWRKDGRVNVAKELARLTPSQLIWQSAVAAEPEVANDTRLRAVEKVIHGFRLDQLHPLVRITLPLVKEHHGSEEEVHRRNGSSRDQQHDRQRQGNVAGRRRRTAA